MDFISAEPVEFSRQGLHSVNLKLIMRVSCIYTVMSFLAVGVFAAHGSFSQTPGNRMTKIGLENETLAAVFTKIKEQTGLAIYYPGKVDEYKNISLMMAKRTVKEVLDLVLEETDLSYRFKDNAVMVYVAGKEIEVEPYLNEASSSTTMIFTVSGKVTDAITEQPLPGASIVVKGTTRGTTTDGEGRFVVDAGEYEVIVFSFIGYKKQEITVSRQTNFNISLEPDINKLETVTINAGYYTTTERTKTGNIAKVTSKEIENQPVTSPLMALQGRVPGLEITPANGAPGAAPKIRIRGENSLSAKFSGGGYPLYIVDGVVIDSRPLQSASSIFYGFGIDPLVNLNPGNIESIEVLKDADATSIYGSRGANGVILITTKKSAINDGTSLDINFYRGVGEIARRMDVLNTQQYLEMRNEAFKNDGTSPGVFDFDVNGTYDSTRYTDWQDKLIGGKAYINDVQLNFSGGSKLTSFRLGGGFHRETTVFPGDFGQKRATGNFNLNHRSSNHKLEVNFSVSYGISKQNMFNSSLVSDAIRLPPNAPQLYNNDGSLNWQIVSIGGNPRSSFNNPLAGLLVTYDATMGSLVANTMASYKILPDLILKTSFGYTVSNGEEISKRPIASNSPTLISANSTGSSSFGNNNRSSWIIEPQLNYVKNFNNHAFTAVVGTTWQEDNSKRKLVEAEGYTSDALLNSLKGATKFTFVEDSKAQYRYTALFTRIGYSYKEKYLVNLTGRRDGSSRFGPGNQFGNFGAIGAAWIFSEENFLKDNLKALSFGKLRTSFGTTGNDQIGDYQFYNLYEIYDTHYNGQVTVIPSALFNKNFQWEVTKKFEAALEIGFLNDRVLLETSWYKNRSSNQLVNYPLPTTTGFPSILTNFNATVENTGWEVVLNIKNINSPNFSWATTFNVTLPSNRLVEFPDIEESPYKTIYKVGEPLSIRWLYTWTGVDRETGIHQILDRNSDGIINDSDREFTGATDKIFYGGLLNSIRFKSFELSFLLQFSEEPGGGLGISYLPGLNQSNQPVSVLDRWQTEGDATKIAKYSASFSSSSWYNQQVMQSNYNLLDRFFIRFKTLSCSFNLPKSIVQKASMQSCKIYVQGQNLFTFGSDSSLDPESVGVNLPQLRMITGGIQIKF